ncbi:hypothetical protein KAJ38_01360 [Candidatus Pacearchaeota archaeon]|nr:hypothetical protein [Candidatus Pacearchaeota archaeon]
MDKKIFNVRECSTLDKIASEEIMERAREAEKEIQKTHEQIRNSRPEPLPYYTTISRDTISGKIEYTLFKLFAPDFTVRYVNRH